MRGRGGFDMSPRGSGFGGIRGSPMSKFCSFSEVYLKVISLSPCLMD